MDKVFIAIDLKSFYASVECIERKLDPMTTNLVVADKSRSEKTICLAVTPSLKAYGISGRPRLFEVIQKIGEINYQRRLANGKRDFKASSYNDVELKNNKSLELDYIVARPQMAKYVEVSSSIYKTYLNWIAPEDIHVYSIDEVFMDLSNYLKLYNLSPYELTKNIILNVFNTSGITATAGIGTNLYLAKIAMDIMAKHTKADEDNVRIAHLDEDSYRRKLWDYRPITDFWRIGRGYKKRLEKLGLYTMGDISRFSLKNEEALYKTFGINAELLIDHAWGYEPCGIEDIKSYRPESNSLSSGQVLTCPYTSEKARIVVYEMAEALSLDLVKKGLVTNQLVLTISYDIENLLDPYKANIYTGDIKVDGYGRRVPKHSKGTENLIGYTSLTKTIVEGTLNLFDEIVNEGLLIRRIGISANNVLKEDDKRLKNRQLDMFSNFNLGGHYSESIAEKNLQKAILQIKDKYGKNSILRGINFLEGATGIERNQQIGGHKS